MKHGCCAHLMAFDKTATCSAPYLWPSDAVAHAWVSILCDTAIKVLEIQYESKITFNQQGVCATRYVLDCLADSMPIKWLLENFLQR